jgi:hypothetical protein
MVNVCVAVGVNGTSVCVWLAVTVLVDEGVCVSVPVDIAV